MIETDDIQLNHIYQGDAISVLKTFPDKSIDCVVTSPPYWALRSYNTEPQIWGGEAGCDHDWVSYIMPQRTGKNRGHIDDEWYRESRGAEPDNTESDFCTKCGAWRGNLGLEPHIELYIRHLCDIFDEVHRVLADYGTCWVVIADTYYGSGSGHKNGGKNDRPVHAGAYPGAFVQRISAKTTLERPGNKLRVTPFPARPTQGNELPAKCLSLIPERFAIEMVNRGWIMRNKITYWKPNVIPESVVDRFTVDFEYLYFFTKRQRYYFKQQFEPTKQSSLDRYELASGSAEMIGPIVGGSKYTDDPDEVIGSERFSGQPIHARLNRNKRCVWMVNTSSVKEAHFATFPQDLISIPIDAGCPKHVCTACGLPRIPIFETIAHGETAHPTPDKPIGGTSLDSGAGNKEGGFNAVDFAPLREHRLVGWSLCDCGAGFRSGIVLDPFMGSGTTGIVAKGMGLRYVGIDLNPEYVKMAEKRIDVAQRRLDDFL